MIVRYFTVRESGAVVDTGEVWELKAGVMYKVGQFLR